MNKEQIKNRLSTQIELDHNMEVRRTSAELRAKTGLTIMLTNDADLEITDQLRLVDHINNEIDKHYGKRG